MDKPRKYNREEILAFLKGMPILSLSACKEGKPVASIVVFAIDDDFTIYFASHGDSIKAEALRQNPTLAYSVWKQDTMLVQGGGEARELKDEEYSRAMNKILKAMENIENFWPPILRITGENYTAFAVKPAWIRALDLSQPSYDGAERPFSDLTF
jgi:nitroimidazol reductase NimA-like FMN-containing flavoprotein (pyridoxamine 5'-phosphate oxidase superfamily)